MAHQNSLTKDLILRHAAGDHSPELLRQLDLLAWSAFHEAYEPPPTKVDTAEEAAIRFLRTCPGCYALMTDTEILGLLEENPMLLAQESVEAFLCRDFPSTKNGPQAQDESSEQA